MSLKLSDVERTWLNDDTAPGRAMAMRLVIRAAEFLGAKGSFLAHPGPSQWKLENPATRLRGK